MSGRNRGVTREPVRQREHSRRASRNEVIMKVKHACGPEADTEFFREIDAVFARYPAEAQKYAVRCLRLQTEVLRVDLDRQVAVSRVEDGRIITEFVDRDAPQVREHHSACCAWSGEAPHKKCVEICKE
ncbi:hypothetical protein ABZV31_07845 [Streptomyces sp. NPDC005202]|uniref:hypothetical protein n=1 Tax=Streptomyces sp. NPDC005202 TaxID=3157021 RepID=UPI00339E5F7D